MNGMGDAAQRWREQLEAWAIPDEFLRAVPDSPWQHPTEVFAKRADSYMAKPVGVSWERAIAALEAWPMRPPLGEARRPGGVVLDVGAGAGAASLPLARATTELIAVDQSRTMLDALSVRAASLNLPTRLVQGTWPAASSTVDVADVVLCHHVFYNVADLVPFAQALTDHARRRVVVELPPAHPMRALNPLWLRLHGLRRPDGPTADDAVAVLTELGLDVHLERWPRPPRTPYGSFVDMVASTRRRLCLPAERDSELVDALLQLGVDPAHPVDLADRDGDELVTLWWDR
jgi:SAM-dependent methyltransferase